MVAIVKEPLRISLKRFQAERSVCVAQMSSMLTAAKVYPLLSVVTSVVRQIAFLSLYKWKKHEKVEKEQVKEAAALI